MTRYNIEYFLNGLHLEKRQNRYGSVKDLQSQMLTLTVALHDFEQREELEREVWYSVIEKIMGAIDRRIYYKYVNIVDI